MNNIKIMVMVIKIDSINNSKKVSELQLEHFQLPYEQKASVSFYLRTTAESERNAPTATSVETETDHSALKEIQ